MIQKIKGTMDILPDTTPLYRYMEGIMREEAEKYGFGEIRTPTFENTELFVRGVGDTTDVVQKECILSRIATRTAPLPFAPRARPPLPVL